MYKERLTARERLVLNTLCVMQRPMTARDIAEANQYLSQSTVQVTIRRLLSRGLVKEAGITHSGNVLSREFAVTEKAKKETMLYVIEEYKQVRNALPISGYIMGLINAEMDKEKQRQLIRYVKGLLEDL